MMVFIKLLLAHLIGDFVLQPKSWVAEKEEKKIKSPKLYLHALIHGLLILLLFLDLQYWLPALLIVIVHLVIDLLKLYAQSDKNRTLWFVADQLMHLISIVLIVFLLFNPLWDINEIANNPASWLLLTLLLLITVVSSVIIRVVMENWTEAIRTDNDKDDSLSRAGTYIGILERLFIFLFVITGNWASIGFLITAKSVFRFGDLREAQNRKLTEYVLIGTLLSFGIAISAGLIYSTFTK